MEMNFLKKITYAPFCFILGGCFDHNPNSLSGASCPTSPVAVLKVSYNDTDNRYMVFHTSSASGPNLPNPLRLENLKMSQIPYPAGSTSDFARMSFATVGKQGCEPILEMTQGYKVELNAPSSGAVGARSEGSASSFWSPFLAGAVAGHLLSRPSAPTYYLPPPAPPHGGGTLTGGLSGSNPQELKQQRSQKSGFFSPRKGDSFNPGERSQKQGFFSRPERRSSGGGGFFRKKR